MIGFIVTGHGQFAAGLASAVHMIAGDKPHFQAITFEEEDADSFGPALAGAIEQMRAECDGVLVFADLLGGTPFNQAVMAAQSQSNVEVIAGVNLPILIELYTRRKDNTSLEKLRDTALKIGKVSISVTNPAELAADDADEGTDDGEGI